MPMFPHVLRTGRVLLIILLFLITRFLVFLIVDIRFDIIVYFLTHSAPSIRYRARLLQWFYGCPFLVNGKAFSELWIEAQSSYICGDCDAHVQIFHIVHDLCTLISEIMKGGIALSQRHECVVIVLDLDHPNVMCHELYGEISKARDGDGW